MDLEIRHLRLVDMIAREGGLTAASVKLYVTQSALSHQLREIEDKLGTQLFFRVNRKMILTEAGRRVLRSAQSILNELTTTEQEVRRLAEGSEGVLRISTQCNTCYHWLPVLIRKFQMRYPRVDVQINVEATSDPYRALWKGDLDLALLYSLPAKKGLRLYPLFRDELTAIMHPDHPLAKKDFVTPQHFANENLIMYMVPREESLLFQKVLTPAGVVPAKVTQVMLTEAIIEMVKAGLGISVMSRWLTAPYSRDRVVRAVRVTKKGLVRNWVAAALEQSGVPSYVEVFTRLLAKSALPANY
jgi:LysR family transcriptional regulator for metE and metH